LEKEHVSGRQEKKNQGDIVNYERGRTERDQSRHKEKRNSKSQTEGKGNSGRERMVPFRGHSGGHLEMEKVWGGSIGEGYRRTCRQG